MKSEDFLYFLIQLKIELERNNLCVDDYILVYDNCKMHFLKNSINNDKIFHVIRLPKCSCQLNPIELFFGYLKRKFRFKFLKSNV